LEKNDGLENDGRGFGYDNPGFYRSCGFFGTTLTLSGLLLASLIYIVARSFVGYADWDSFEGFLKSGMATLLLLTIVYIWGVAIYRDRSAIDPIINNILGIFIK